MTYYGQFETDKVIATYFPRDYIGSCIEIGAADGIKGSNSKYFEDKGWTTLCIEAIPEFCEIMKQSRQHVLEVACGSANLDNENFYVYTIGKNNIKSSLSGLNTDPRLLVSHGHLINDKQVIKVNVRTLDSILSEVSIFKNIDFISIDTENTEFDVIKGFSTLPLWNVQLLVVENNFNDPDIEEYLKSYHYRKDQRYEVNDFYVLDLPNKTFVSDGEFESEDVDKYLRTFFPDYSYKGVFVDVGAFHSQWLSNSYHFEINGWKTICVEPNPYCHNELNKHRKCVLLYAAYCKNEDNVDFCIDNFGKSTWHMAGASALKVDYKPHVSLKETVKVNARTLDFILEEQKVNQLDVLSIDVEGSEIHVLEGVDLVKWKPKIIVVENIQNKKAQETYLSKFGYQKIHRIAFNDFYKKT